MELAKLAKQNNKTPYVQNNIFGDKDDGNRFFEIAYFKGNLNKWVLGQPLPENSILLTEVDTIQGMKKVSSPNDKLSILFN
jgi:hypothetical protein